MITNINLLNFKPQLSPKKNDNNISNVFGFNINTSKLAPLKKDTVSFTGLPEYRAAFNNIELCKKLHENAKPANQYLQVVIDKYFSHEVYDEQKNPDGIIAALRARVKGPTSLEGKICDKISSALEPKNKKHFNELIFSPYSEEDIKEHIRDISGARIVVTENHDGAMDKVVDGLCKMIIQENLIIDEIQHNISPDPSAIPYFSDEQLEKIQKAVNIVRQENGLDEIKADVREKETGYMALHLSVDTRYIPKLAKNQGFWSEIQIMGLDVEILKDIEDFCYKWKRDLNISSEKLAYGLFEKMFKDAYDDIEHYPDVQELYRQYTIKAYLAQKNRLPSDNAKDDIKNWAYRYPTIKDCGFEGKIPPILDFNILARIKRDCDDLHNVEINSEAILNEINS